MVVVNRFEDLDVYIKTLKEIGDIDIEIFVSNLISNLDYGFFQLETDKLEELDDFELYSILEKIADKAQVKTYGDLLRGFGFTKYEYYINGKLESSIILNNKVINYIQRNMISSVGSTKNLQ